MSIEAMVQRKQFTNLHSFQSEELKSNFNLLSAERYSYLIEKGA
jgi:hypothetical protein